MKYTYRFDNGETIVVDVDESWCELLQRSDTEMNSKDRHQERHTCSLDAMDFEGQAFAFTDSGFEEIFGIPEDEIEQEKRIREIINTYKALTESQKELFRAVFIRHEKIIDIAKRQGVSQPAVSRKIYRIRKNFEKFLK